MVSASFTRDCRIHSSPFPLGLVWFGLSTGLRSPNSPSVYLSVTVPAPGSGVAARASLRPPRLPSGARYAPRADIVPWLLSGCTARCSRCQGRLRAASRLAKCNGTRITAQPLAESPDSTSEWWRVRACCWPAAITALKRRRTRLNHRSRGGGGGGGGCLVGKHITITTIVESNNQIFSLANNSRQSCKNIKIDTNIRRSRRRCLI